MGQVPSKGQGINQKGQQIRNEEITSSARQIYVHFWGLFSEFDQFVYQIMSEMKQLYDGTSAGTCRGAANTNVFPQNLLDKTLKSLKIFHVKCCRVVKHISISSKAGYKTKKCTFSQTDTGNIICYFAAMQDYNKQLCVFRKCASHDQNPQRSAPICSLVSVW